MRRRSLLATATIGVVLLALLAVTFWRVLPPLVPNARGANTAEKPFAGVPALPTALSRPRLAAVRAAVLVEPENVRVTPPGRYEATIRYWRSFLQDVGATLVAPEEAEVLVVPDAQCLGPVHRRLIAAHLTRGGGIVTTGAVGAYDGVCTPLADTLLAQLVGIADRDIRRAPAKRGEPFYALLLGETVLAAHLPPGARLEFNPANEIVFRHPQRELLYSDYDRRPLSAGGAYFDAAAMRALNGRGRVVALGFSPVELADEWSVANGRILLTNAVEWAAGRHVFQLAPWPDGKQAAAVLAHDVEADYQNARIALDALEPYGLPGTAFIVGQLALADPVTTKRLIASMEIGTHTHRHLPLDTLSTTAHDQELSTSKREAERILGRAVGGMRPPEERYTPRTLQVWADLGGTYVFASNNTRAAAPEIIPILPDSLVLLGRVAEDDYEILARDKLRNRNEMTRVLLQRVGEAIAYRGLYMFSYHSHMFAQRDLVPVLQALADRLSRTQEIWTTTAGQVAAWWRSRAAIQFTPAGDGQSVLLTNAGRAPVTGAILLIDAPDGSRRTLALPPMAPDARIRVTAAGQWRLDAPLDAPPP